MRSFAPVTCCSLVAVWMHIGIGFVDSRDKSADHRKRSLFFSSARCVLRSSSGSVLFCPPSLHIRSTSLTGFHSPARSSYLGFYFDARLETQNERRVAGLPRFLSLHFRLPPNGWDSYLGPTAGSLSFSYCRFPSSKHGSLSCITNEISSVLQD